MDFCSGERLGFGVLKAPVDERWSFSYSSCSALGSRGGAGPRDKELARASLVELNIRRAGCEKYRRREEDIFVGRGSGEIK